MVTLVIIFITLLFYLVYTKIVLPIQYWKKKNVFYVNPGVRFYKAFFGSKSFFETVRDAYINHPDKRYYGSYQFFRPSLVVRDIEIIKQITTKDFEYFPNHTKFVTGTNDPIIDLNLFSLEDEKWKDMRSTLSPAFTSSKMKAMFLLIQETADNFTQHFLRQKNNNVIEIEMKGTFSKFTNDVIASCAFGVHCNSLKNDKNEFFKKGSIVANPTAANIVRSVLFALFPKIFLFFRLSVLPASISDFFKKLVKETVALRERDSIVRPDMIHLLMESRKGRLKHDSSEKNHDAGFATVEESSLGKSQSKLELTEDVMAAQVLVFFLAGFETSSTLLSFVSYHLAINPSIQMRLYEEINEVVNHYSSSNVSYEDLLNMKYLDQVVSETLRMYPPGYILTRACAKDYLIKAKNSDEVDFVLDKGTAVTIPVSGVHMDPKYFPDPDKFDPDRFNDENKGKIISGSYMPFGSGPRNCIGSRFALLESKTLIVSLLNNFEIVPVEKTVIPIKLSKTFNLGVKGGLWLGLKKRVK